MEHLQCFHCIWKGMWLTRTLWKTPYIVRTLAFNSVYLSINGDPWGVAMFGLEGLSLLGKAHLKATGGT